MPRNAPITECPVYRALTGGTGIELGSALKLLLERVFELETRIAELEARERT